MRVALVVECFLPSVNGVTNTVLRILEHLQLCGHDALVIAPNDPRGVPDSYAGFPVITTASLTFPWYPEMRLSTTLTAQIEKHLADFNPDVVHLAAPVVLGHKGALAAGRLGLPSVALYQTEVPRYATQYGYPAAEPFLWRHLRKVHNMATVNLAPSGYTRDQLIARGFARVDVWGRGVNTERFNPTRRDPGLHQTWAPNGEVVIGYMGRLATEKQVADLSVLADLPDTQMVIIGDGPLRGDLEERLPNAIFVGMKSGDDLPRHLASLDLFVHPGELETFGQAIQEAQACGLATIAPRRGGPTDLVIPATNGWLYTPGDLRELREHTIALVDDAHRRMVFGRAARARVKDRSWAQLCDQLLDHYSTAMLWGVRSQAKIA